MEDCAAAARLMSMLDRSENAAAEIVVGPRNRDASAHFANRARLALEEAALQRHAAAASAAGKGAAEVAGVGGVERHVSGVVGAVEIGHADCSGPRAKIDSVGEAAG